MPYALASQAFIAPGNFTEKNNVTQPAADC